MRGRAAKSQWANFNFVTGLNRVLMSLWALVGTTLPFPPLPTADRATSTPFLASSLRRFSSFFSRSSRQRLCSRREIPTLRARDRRSQK